MPSAENDARTGSRLVCTYCGTRGHLNTPCPDLQTAENAAQQIPERALITALRDRWDGLPGRLAPHAALADVKAVLLEHGWQDDAAQAWDEGHRSACVYFPDCQTFGHCDPNPYRPIPPAESAGPKCQKCGQPVVYSSEHLKMGPVWKCPIPPAETERVEE